MSWKSQAGVGDGEEERRAKSSNSDGDGSDSDQLSDVLEPSSSMHPTSLPAVQ